MLKKIIAIIGARPQFIKHFPFELAAKGKLDLVTIHTGQHYDQNMSQVFFDELGMKRPDYMLDIGSAGHAVQTGKMMMAIDEVVQKEKPDGMVVYGDTNSTLAGALVAAKRHIPIFHIEAGLRSFNKKMPEEINRILTDHLSSRLFVPSESAQENLCQEGIERGVVVVGDIMKDLVVLAKKKGWIKERTWLEPYYYTTLHRPYNTDDQGRLTYVLTQLDQLNNRVIFAAHPRTLHAMERFGLSMEDFPNVQFIAPQSYFANLSALFHAKALITDSGGMQKEAYWLQKKCITIRTETEWVETQEGGWNTLLFEDLSGMDEILQGSPVNYQLGLYGNGDTAPLITQGISSDLNSFHI